jgi:hypothetical protein
VEALICANTRTPEVTWGDVKAQVHTNTYGLSKFGELFAKHGVDTVLACWQRWMELCESELRRAISAVPDGIYGPETDYLDDDGVDLDKPHRISSLESAAIRCISFSTDVQACGPINLRPCGAISSMPGQDDFSRAAREHGLRPVARCPIRRKLAVPGACAGQHVRSRASPTSVLAGAARALLGAGARSAAGICRARTPPRSGRCIRI